MERFSLPRWLRFGGLAALLLALLPGCAREARPDGKQVLAAPMATGRRYVVHFAAVRRVEQTPLSSFSVPVVVGRASTVRLGRARPTEQTPVFNSATATLSRTRAPGTFQLVTKVALREASRTRKGKLKVNPRNEGSLLPIRVGETQPASTPEDPVQISVRLEPR